MDEKIKEPFFTKHFEMIIAIFLGITALLTAWASWIGSLHGGNQATNYTKSNNLAAMGNSTYTESFQNLTSDMQLWNTISDMLIDMDFAKKNNDQTEYERLDWKLNKMYEDNVSEELHEAINWAQEQEEYASPFDKEGYVESYFTEAKEMIAESETIYEQGQMDNTNGDREGLVTVIYSVVLFLLGIVGTFDKMKNKYIIFGVAMAGFVIATILMSTIPLPTGFSMASFFKGA